MPSADLQLSLDPHTRQAIVLVALYLLTALGGVLAFAHEARFGGLGLAIGVGAAALLLLTTFHSVPVLRPISVAGLTFTAMAGISGIRGRSGRHRLVTLPVTRPPRALTVP